MSLIFSYELKFNDVKASIVTMCGCLIGKEGEDGVDIEECGLTVNGLIAQ